MLMHMALAIFLQQGRPRARNCAVLLMGLEDQALHLGNLDSTPLCRALFSVHPAKLNTL